MKRKHKKIVGVSVLGTLGLAFVALAHWGFFYGPVEERLGWGLTIAMLDVCIAAWLLIDFATWAFDGPDE